MMQYIRHRWQRVRRLWKSNPRSTIPYYIVRTQVEAGFERRSLIIDTFVDVALLLAIGFALDATLRQPPVWFLIIAGIVTYLIIVGISIALNLTIDTIGFFDEDRRVEACIDFVQQQAFSREHLQEINTLAALNSSAVQHRLALPTVLLTGIAAVVAIGSLPFGIGFVLGALAVVSLLSFAITTGENHADLIIQKALVVVIRNDEQRRRQPPAELLAHLLQQPIAP